MWTRRFLGGASLFMTLLTCGSLLRCQAPSAEEKDPPKQAMRDYLKAFGAADTAGMGKYYAPEVIVMAGSTLLDKRYGGLGESGARDKATDDREKKESEAKEHKESEAKEKRVQWLIIAEHWN